MARSSEIRSPFPSAPLLKQGGQDVRDESGRAIAGVPSLSLPKGSAAIRGIGEKSAANLLTGIGSRSVPIYTILRRSGFGLQLSLSNDSRARNGPSGFGWNLSLSSIMRKTDKGSG